MNRNAIEDAGLLAAVQVSSWAVITTITTSENTATSPKAALGWGYIHPPSLIQAPLGNGSLTTGGGATVAPDAASMFGCLPVNWADWTKWNTDNAMNSIVLWGQGTDSGALTGVIGPDNSINSVDF